MARADGRAESLEIPDAVRRAVDERDKQRCRFCGHYVGERRAMHHILFGGDLQGMGGRRKHDPDAIVTICWQPGDPKPGMRPCHDVVHGHKLHYQPFLLEVVKRPGTTVLQLMRWEARRKRVASGE